MSSSVVQQGYDSNIHRALAIPELLSIVCSYSTTAENARNALVSRQWNSVALDHIWKEVDNLYYILRILVPMHSRNDHPFAFTRPPTQQDWTRFAPYARRVRSIRYQPRSDHQPRSEYHHILDDSVFQDLARTRTSLAVFPNLRLLWWEEFDTRAHQLVFMHEGITEFHVLLQPLAPQSVMMEGYFADVTARMPALQTLCLLCPLGDGGYIPTAAFQTLVAGAQKLKRIKLPKDSLNGATLKELAKLPHLGAIEFDTDGGLKSDNTPTIQKTLAPTDFPALWDLCLNSDLADMRTFLVGGALLPNLKCLFVDSLNAEKASTVHDLLVDIAASYPDLEMFAMDVVVPMHEQLASETLTLSHIRPLLSLKSLKSLELRHNFPLDLTEEDVAELAQALPKLENLVLNPEPLELCKPTLDLQVLLTLARHCPALQKVSIYLNADATSALSLPSTSTSRLFPALHTLVFGVSPIAAEHVPISLFLSHLVSDNAVLKIEYGLTWSDELYQADDVYAQFASVRYDRWAEVAKTVPLLLELRKQERRERRNIEREVEDLRMRNEVLMERAKLTSKSSLSAQLEKGCVMC
ncbi:hypothetical protein FA95DRAFT_1558387 [Auriscalpium vulgare]|uniref:Uncharacterized protein n=1 Tax=Auriscalpium vulgare TaxID=40419 RepID=A0ACB8RX61_9AGAM|nr:hypothetical protein FA95DRAFT_1558387 [Auriscalpium vulgare]